jgi:signal transduction histidine kinase
MARRRSTKVASVQLAIKGLKESQLRKEVASLKRQNDELVQLNKSKDEFIAITSHQLRTPATGVKQYLGLLLEGYSDPLTENQKVLLQKAYDNNDRQLNIVDDILRVAQIDLEKIILRKAATDINKLVEDGISVLKEKFNRLEQKVQFKKKNDPIEASVDKKQFQLVIENLLENAANYTPDGGNIDIETSVENGAAIIKIADSGIGIDSEDFSKLFQKFSRIQNQFSNAVSGTGLGLYFCKKIVELHHGTIQVESTLNRGTTFTITVPVKLPVN